MNLNFLLIIVVILAVYKVVDGYKKGMVKEIVSLVSMAVLCAVAALIAGGISSYNSGRIFNVIVAAILLILVLITHQLLKVVFFSAKLVSKLPVVHFVNKLLGMVFGVFEVVLLLWTVYTLIMMMELGAIEQIIVSYTQESKMLVWIYEHNYLAYLIELLLSKFSFVPLAGLQ
ncbi:MAG: CvpA family protein [Acetatifactor sp.]|nr:CvpA family protein [Acetatifactor sp.]